MTTVGTGAPRVVVRPPNVPAPPPISLLTQNNVVDDNRDVLNSDGERWIAGGGTTWMEPVQQMDPTTLWQRWPGDGGSASSSTKPGSVDKITDDYQSPVQLPMIMTLMVSAGVLASFALANSVEGSIEQQLAAAHAALAARVVEHELWTGVEADTAGWVDQFRLKSADHVDTPYGGAAIPFLRALALAEQAAADAKFIDNFGGAMIHVTPALFSLITGQHQGLSRNPTGRQWQTPSGCALVCEPGATGIWPESASASLEESPGLVGNNSTYGWLFVTPPVRVRFSSPQVDQYEGVFEDTNDRALLVERAFTIEASVRNDSTSIGIPVDYTQES